MDEISEIFRGFNMAEFLGEFEFVVNGKGNRPTDRHPWGSRAPGLTFTPTPGERPPASREGLHNGGLFQFFVDADGFPVVTTDGHLVHFDESWKHLVVVA